MKITIDPRAKRDIEAIADYLNGKRTGTGNAFYRAFKEAHRAIRAFPQSFGLTEDRIPGFETREYVIDRFNYRVVYLVTGRGGTIFAVIHSARFPASWQERVSDDPQTENGQ